MPFKTSNTADSLHHRLFIAKQSEIFSRCLQDLDDSTKHIIKNNKKLNELYDVFLDFIIDSSQHLDYNDAKNQE